MMADYVVATVKSWNIDSYQRHKSELPGNWFMVDTPEKLSEILNDIQPKYIFFPHWSWIVPDEIIDNYSCVCFHMTDVPYGRGGSPLQNLIKKGHTETKLTALKMVKELDAGPVYMKISLSLSGSAQDIYNDMSEKIYEMIKYIIENEPVAKEQKGEIVSFKRRNPSQSILPESSSVKEMYNHIRMLDAETYPHAYITYGDFKIEFTNAKLNGGKLICEVTIIKE